MTNYFWFENFTDTERARAEAVANDRTDVPKASGHGGGNIDITNPVNIYKLKSFLRISAGLRVNVPDPKLWNSDQNFIDAINGMESVGILAVGRAATILAAP